MAHLVGDLLGLDAVGTWGGERGAGRGEGGGGLTVDECAEHWGGWVDGWW